MLHRANNIKNEKINPRDIANFRKCTKIYTRENIYVHSRPISPGHLPPGHLSPGHSYTRTYTPWDIYPLGHIPLGQISPEQIRLAQTFILKECNLF